MADSKSDTNLEPIFLLGIRVATMRGAGLNEAQIGCIIQDVRSHALNEEFRRIKNLITDSPPHHHTWVQTMKDLPHAD